MVPPIPTLTTLHNRNPRTQVFIFLEDLHHTYSASTEQGFRAQSAVGFGKMADYSFGGTDEENAELKKLNAEVVSPQHLLTLYLGKRS